MYKISKSNPSAQNLRIYGDKLYIFSNDVLITVFNRKTGRDAGVSLHHYGVGWSQSSHNMSPAYVGIKRNHEIP